jgi:fumarate reductase subunit C
LELVLALCSGISLLFFAFWSWFFRDGLKAGFVPSEGIAAWIGFFQAFWLPLVVLLAIIALSYFFYQRTLFRLSGKQNNQAF